MLDVHMTSWRRADEYWDKIGEPNINAIQSYRYFNVFVCPYCHTQQQVNRVLKACLGTLTQPKLINIIRSACGDFGKLAVLQ